MDASNSRHTNRYFGSSGCVDTPPLADDSALTQDMDFRLQEWQTLHPKPRDGNTPFSSWVPTPGCIMSLRPSMERLQQQVLLMLLLLLLTELLLHPQRSRQHSASEHWAKDLGLGLGVIHFASHVAGGSVCCYRKRLARKNVLFQSMLPLAGI